MESIECLVQGSGSEPYRVVIRKDGGNLTAFCSCPAGSNGQSCKHRLRLLSGNPEGALDVGKDQLAMIVSWVSGSDVEVALQALAKAEDQLALSQRAVAAAKKRLAEALRT